MRLVRRRAVLVHWTHTGKRGRFSYGLSMKPSERPTGEAAHRRGLPQEAGGTEGAAARPTYSSHRPTLMEEVDDPKGCQTSKIFTWEPSRKVWPIWTEKVPVVDQDHLLYRWPCWATLHDLYTTNRTKEKQGHLMTCTTHRSNKF